MARHLNPTTRATESFIGGKPELPRGTPLPHCSLCGQELTFFLQVALPLPSAWQGHSLSVFACTACASESSFIPEMLAGGLSGADVPLDFLARYEQNFRCLVFETRLAEPVTEYQERLARVFLDVGRFKRPGSLGRLGSPKWVLEDESPASVGGTPATFLLQWYGEHEFRAVPGAPAQADILIDGSLGQRRSGSYRLFLKNELYFFGGTPRETPVYVLTQVD